MERASTYGLTWKELETLEERTGLRCEICQEPGTCIDHDHATGEVRGMLCHACNTGLGKFRDDPALLRAAIGYLDQ